MSRTQQQEQPQKNKKQQQKKTEKPKERIDPIGPVADPDLQIKGGGGRSSKPWDQGGGG